MFDQSLTSVVVLSTSNVPEVIKWIHFDSLHKKQTFIAKDAL